MDTEHSAISRRRLPDWLKKRSSLSEHVRAMKRRLRRHDLHTVCEEARCPNVGECFSRGTATILILGNVCTRRCGFCAIAHGEPAPVDPGEPERVAAQVAELNLRHAVVTAVSRDDLDDGGAAQFANAIRSVRGMNPQTTVEVLTPDFEGRLRDIQTVCEASPDVFNHNVETVERLSCAIRDRADYRRSLFVLAMARGFLPRGIIKSGLMVGLGEKKAEVESTLRDLKGSGCDIVTIGQYLQPTRKNLPVVEYVSEEAFREYEDIGLRYGLRHVFSGPFVRSSYLADGVAFKHPRHES